MVICPYSGTRAQSCREPCVWFMYESGTIEMRRVCGDSFRSWALTYNYSEDFGIHSAVVALLLNYLINLLQVEVAV